MSGPPDDTDDVAFDSLESVTHGAMVNGGGVFTQRMLQFLVNFALTQGLPVALFGVYSLGDRIVRLLSRFSPLGADQSVVRFLPEYDDPARRNRIVGVAYLTAAVASGLIAAGLFVLAPWINAVTIAKPSFVGVIRLFALMLPAFTFIRLFANVFRTLELVEYQALLMRVGIPGARLLAVLVALALGYSVLGLVGAALGTAGSMAFVNVLRLGQLWYLEDLQPYTRKYLKPVVAAVGMAVAMATLRPFFDGTVLLIVGSVVGVGVFAVLLRVFGIESRDYRLFASLYDQYRPGGTVQISRRSD